MSTRSAPNRPSSPPLHTELHASAQPPSARLYRSSSPSSPAATSNRGISPGRAHRRTSRPGGRLEPDPASSCLLAQVHLATISECAPHRRRVRRVAVLTPHRSPCSGEYLRRPLSPRDDVEFPPRSSSGTTPRFADLRRSPPSTASPFDRGDLVRSPHSLRALPHRDPTPPVSLGRVIPPSGIDNCVRADAGHPRPGRPALGVISAPRQGSGASSCPARRLRLDQPKLFDWTSRQGRATRLVTLVARPRSTPTPVPRHLRQGGVATAGRCNLVTTLRPAGARATVA